MLFFGIDLQWLPISGLVSMEYERLGPWGKFCDLARHLVLPITVYTVGSLAGMSRYMRACMLEVLRQDYILTARAKGLSPRQVILRHALRNALLPVITLLGLSVPGLIGGSVIIESIFALPGLGQLFYSAVMARDYTMIMGNLVLGAVLTLAGLEAVIAIDLATCAGAVGCILFIIHFPAGSGHGETTNVLRSVREGLRWLWRNRGVLDMILFLAAINLIASVYNAALAPMVLSRPGGGETALGILQTCTGLANLAGSLLVTLLPAPKSRVRVICNSLLFSMATENLMLALGRAPWIWCFGAVLGWLFIPVMNSNLSALLRLHIPVELQGRVYAARNTLQFFTIPVGYLLGGWLVDKICEPFMAGLGEDAFLIWLLGSGKGGGAALVFLFLSAAGVLVCLAFRRDKCLWKLEE